MIRDEWFKSSRSGAAGHCVEVKAVGSDGEVLVRDAKNRDGGTLTFTGQEWDAFIEGAKAGEFDL